VQSQRFNLASGAVPSLNKCRVASVQSALAVNKTSYRNAHTHWDQQLKDYIRQSVPLVMRQSTVEPIFTLFLRLLHRYIPFSTSVLRPNFLQISLNLDATIFLSSCLRFSCRLWKRAGKSVTPSQFNRRCSWRNEYYDRCVTCFLTCRSQWINLAKGTILLPWGECRKDHFQASYDSRHNHTSDYPTTGGVNVKPQELTTLTPLECSNERNATNERNAMSIATKEPTPGPEELLESQEVSRCRFPS